MRHEHIPRFLHLLVDHSFRLHDINIYKFTVFLINLKHVQEWENKSITISYVGLTKDCS